MVGNKNVLNIHTRLNFFVTIDTGYKIKDNCSNGWVEWKTKDGKT